MKTYSETFSTIRAEANSMGERNDCGVIAVSIATRRPYKEAHALLARHGRPFRKGSPFSAINKSLIALGAKLQGDANTSPARPSKYFPRNHVVGTYVYPKQPNGSQYTMKTIGKAFPKGTYLVYNSRHVAAMIDGRIHDWSEDRAKRVTMIQKVEFEGHIPAVEPVPTPQPKPVVIKRETATTKRTRKDGEGQYQRNGVSVNGVNYRSVKAAFIALNLPLAKHIKFRMELKKVGCKTFAGFVFTIV